MMSRKKRSIGVRALNAGCAVVLLGAGIYIFMAGFQFAAVAALVCCTVAVATPVFLSGEGILEVISGIFEALLDGLMAILEAIASVFADLFG
jgi:hypothetical protein